MQRLSRKNYCLTFLPVILYLLRYKMTGKNFFKKNDLYELNLSLSNKKEQARTTEKTTQKFESYQNHMTYWLLTATLTFDMTLPNNAITSFSKVSLALTCLYYKSFQENVCITSCNDQSQRGIHKQRGQLKGDGELA